MIVIISMKRRQLTLIQNAKDSDMRMTRLKHVAQMPRTALGAFSDAYIGATTAERPVAIPEMTRPA